MKHSFFMKDVQYQIGQESIFEPSYVLVSCGVILTITVATGLYFKHIARLWYCYL